MKWAIFLFLSPWFLSVNSNGFGPGKQDYGYFTVRNGAHMFWWLYHTTANVTDSSERPLIMWLQGGPGGSSCGHGNFEIIGPLDLDLKPRNHTWVKDFNVLFVDNPVGTGYSYVEDQSLLTNDNLEIARDLVTLMKSFYEKLPQFKNTPFYVYGESYGGKMALDFVKLLHEEVIAGKIQSNISGVAMGNAMISAMDSVLSWAPFLYQAGLVDKKGENDILKQAEYTKKVFDQGDFFQSLNEFITTQTLVTNRTDGATFYSILNKRENGYYELDKQERLTILMNDNVKKALNIPESVVWPWVNFKVIFALAADIVKPVTEVVESLLNKTNLKVHVYNGNLDIIANTPGQLMWVDRLRWCDRDAYLNASRNTIRINNLREGYEKTGGKFTFFWINSAGHSVPADNPVGTRWILKSMTGF